MSSNAEDEDCAFLEHVLDKLYDFGAPQKKKQKKKIKRKRCDEEEEEPPEEDLCRQVEEEDRVIEDVTEDEAGHLGGGGQLVKRAETKVEVVTFQDPRKKQKAKRMMAPSSMTDAPITDKEPSGQLEELNLEKARLEVHRFGITGYEKKQQRVFEQDRAVMLGARPHKKSYINYKLLQQQIRDRKQKAKEEVQPELKKKKSSQQDKKKTSAGTGVAPSGQVGRFRDGMLILSSKEIQKIKSKRSAR
ncbi:unnamed protein product [Ophioblennius macclurei]